MGTLNEKKPLKTAIIIICTTISVIAATGAIVPELLNSVWYWPFAIIFGVFAGMGWSAKTQGLRGRARRPVRRPG